jgi:prepilin-type N-terminal cleavage/methylation domain-containing protein
MRNNKGFSLVELIVVIAIMAILAAVAIPTFATFIGKAQQASDIDFMNQVQSGAELAFATQTAEVTEITVDLDDKTVAAITVKVGNDTFTFTKSGTAFTAPTNVDDSVKSSVADFAAILDGKYEFKSTEEKLEAHENWNSNWKFAD